MFARELWRAGQLKHRNIVDIKGFCAVEETLDNYRVSLVSTWAELGTIVGNTKSHASDFDLIVCLAVNYLITTQLLSRPKVSPAG